MSTRRLRMLGLLLLVGVAILLPARPASAAVPTTASPTWQTNATVWVTTYARGAFYLAGDFTKVRPPGAALGVNEVTRTYMAAFSASTGGLLAFKHTFNARPSAIARSPDGSKRAGLPPSTPPPARSHHGRRGPALRSRRWPSPLTAARFMSAAISGI